MSAPPFSDGSDTSDSFVVVPRPDTQLERRIEQLEEALETRTTIARAQGMLMERYSIGEDPAIALLIRISNDTNTRVRQLAERILDGATIEEIWHRSRSGSTGT